MKKTTSELVSIINEGKVKAFVSYLNAKGEINETVKKAVFKSKHVGIIKAYVNRVFPAGSEFYKHQDLVAMYGDRKTLATYYLYHSLDEVGQIALIKRGDFSKFSYFVGRRPKLTEKAFEFLVKHGKPRLIKYYLENCMEKDQIVVFAKFGSVKYLKYFAKIAMPTELEVLAKAINSTATAELKDEIANECKELRFWLLVSED